MTKFKEGQRGFRATVELHPCPWCGGGSNVGMLNNGSFNASCSDYNCKGFCGFTREEKEDAIMAWNRRASRKQRRANDT